MPRGMPLERSIVDFVYEKSANRHLTGNFCGWGIISDPAMAVTNFLPKTRAMVDRIYNFLQARPSLYNMVLSIAQKHDHWMDYRKYGDDSYDISALINFAG